MQSVVMTKSVVMVVATLTLLSSLALVATPANADGTPETNPGEPKASPAHEASPTPKSPAPKPAPKPARKVAPRRMPKPDAGVPTARTVRSMMRLATKDLPFKKLKIRTSDVYYGNYRRFQRAAVIDTQKVFDAIPHYRELRRLELDKKSGRYWVLIQRSNRIFHRALRKIANDHGYQLIGAKGAIVVDGKMPDDVTDAVLKILPGIHTY
jgi:hypothetical protein